MGYIDNKVVGILSMRILEHETGEALQVAKEAVGEDCLTMQINVVPLGTIGLLLAAGAWNVLFGVQVLGVGQGKEKPEVRQPLVEAGSLPSTFQECRDPVAPA